MQKEESKIMEELIDKLCDHLPPQRIRVLIDNGFDEWETITFLKGEELIEVGFNSEECIIIMVAINSNSKQNGGPEVFSQQKMRQIASLAKDYDQKRQEQVRRQEQELKKQEIKSKKSEPHLLSYKSIKQYPKKQLSQALILKGTSVKAKQGQKVNLQKLTMVSLQQKQITQIDNLEKVPNLINLHLGNNHIYRIQGLETLSKLKVLKLEYNQICRIEGLDSLIALERLFLSNNYISRLENLTKQPNLQYISISRQKIETNLQFDPQSMYALAYTLQKLECDQCKVRSITNLKYLSVIKELSLAKNEIDDINQLSETLTNMERLRIVSFKDNPLAKTQKYRDYVVILSKSVEELDGKKILTKQRQYLVKLYALKHAKQNKEGGEFKKNSAQGPLNLQGTKMEEEYGYNNININKATDLRGNAPHMNTKHIRK